MIGFNILNYVQVVNEVISEVLSLLPVIMDSLEAVELRLLEWSKLALKALCHYNVTKRSEAFPILGSSKGTWLLAWFIFVC